MTDQETIDKVTARLRDDITIHFVAELDEFHVTIGDDVTVFAARYLGTRALEGARKFAIRRQRDTSRQIFEIV